MNKIDLIIDALEQADRMRRKQGYTEEYLQEALTAAQKLRDSLEEEYNPYEIGKRLRKEGYGISEIGIRVKCDADIDQAIKGYCDQMELTK